MRSLLIPGSIQSVECLKVALYFSLILAHLIAFRQLNFIVQRSSFKLANQSEYIKVFSVIFKYYVKDFLYYLNHSRLIENNLFD